MIEERLKPFICKRFLEDEHYRNGHIHILAVAPNTKILGLHTPEMKFVAKEIAQNDECAFILDGLYTQLQEKGRQSLYHEERMVWGLIINYMKCPLEERLQRILQFIPCIDNWAICDNFCCNSSWIKQEDSEIIWHFITNLFQVKEEFFIRTATILAMCHFLDTNSLQRTFTQIKALKLHENEPYYVRMGIAWLLATALAKHENETRTFVALSKLPKDIVKLYVRKARESRITREIAAL